MTDRARRSAGLRAKLTTGLAYLGTFCAAFVAIRLYIARMCADYACYEGVTPAPGIAAARTAAYNLMSAVPGAGRNELVADLDLVGWESKYPVLPTSWSILLGIVGAAALLMLWSATRADPLVTTVTKDADPSHIASPRAGAMLLVVGAGLGLDGRRRHRRLDGPVSPVARHHHRPGTLYRNAMVTWTGLALCGVLGALAVGCAPARTRCRRGLDRPGSDRRGHRRHHAAQQRDGSARQPGPVPGRRGDQLGGRPGRHDTGKRQAAMRTLQAVRYLPLPGRPPQAHRERKLRIPALSRQTLLF